MTFGYGGRYGYSYINGNVTINLFGNKNSISRIFGVASAGLENTLGERKLYLEYPLTVTTLVKLTEITFGKQSELSVTSEFELPTTSLTLNILEPSERIILNTGLSLIDYTKLKFKFDNELVTVNWTVNGTVKTGDILNSEYKLVSDNGNNLKLMKK
jgi:hypothetical protein